VFLVGGLFFCLIVAMGQFVNPFPVDGWFQSQYRLFGTFTGQDNYTPIAAPAFLYAAVHHLSAVLTLNLEQEFYLGSIVNNLLLFLATAFLYFSNRLLGMARIGILCSALTLLYLESTFLPQSFWSENSTFFLMAAILYLTVILYSRVHIPYKKFLTLTIVFGLLLGLLTITRATPIVFLPAVILLFAFRLNRFRAGVFSVTTVCLITLIITTAMTANYYRFGRFELSNSTGRHLWNAVSPTADTMLAESREYRLLKRYTPNIQGKGWGKVEYKKCPEFKNFDREALLKRLAFDAIKAKPGLFVYRGAVKTRELLLKPLWKLGLDGSKKDFNPLNRDSFLPPIFPVLEPFKKFLGASNRFIGLFYKSTIFIALYIIAAVLITQLWIKLLHCLFALLKLRRGLANAYGFTILPVCQALLLLLGRFFYLPRPVILSYSIILIGCYVAWLYRSADTVKTVNNLYLKLNTYIPVSLFLFCTYMGGVYLNWLVESPTPRHTIPYLPLLSLMVSLAIKMSFIFFKAVIDTIRGRVPVAIKPPV
jgi:hypothetical protein